MKAPMKKMIALVLCLVMVFSLAACGKSSSGKSSSKGNGTAPETVRLLGYSAQESSLNILRDQLTKAGFEVELNTQPDYSSFTTVLDTG